MNDSALTGELTSDQEAELAQAKALLQQSRFAAAEAALQILLRADPGAAARVEALYMLAVAQRYQKKHAVALATLETLRRTAPDYARGHQEQAYNHLALDHKDEAAAAFEAAVQRNPALLASWKALGMLHREAGEHAAAAKAFDCVAALENLPRELLTVTSLLHENHVHKANRLCRHFLRQHKHHVEGMRLLAEIALRLEVPDDAEFLLESCVEFAPEFDRARYDYANVLLKRQKFAKAHAQAEILTAKDPSNPAVRSVLGSATAGLGKNVEAIEIFNEVLAKSPQQNKIYVMRGHAQKTIGQFDAAIASYRKAYEIDGDYGDAFWSLANTKVYKFTAAEIAHMREHEASASIAEDDRVHMCFALGKAYEDRGEYESAFEYYERGNALKQKEVRHSAEQLALRVNAQIDVCTAEFLESKAGLGSERPDPIFIVGLPRAGSTLLEQILASHSQVDGTLELPNILSLVNRLRGRISADSESGPQYPRILTGLDSTYFLEFGEQFLNDTMVYRAGAPRFIDKMPNNFFHVGLIKLILPRAKIIDARRHPMACCFSGFKQLFGEGQEFTYGLTQVGNYYRQYVRLMEHWDAVLPGFVLRVQHEDVVDELETQVRRMLHFCELPFEQACLDFHKTERSVRTPSSEQVRQPIYRTGLEQWRNFEPWLGPLKEALGPEVLAHYSIASA